MATPEELDDRTFLWSRAPWQGRGEPAEGRSIRVSRHWLAPASVEYEHCRADWISQWNPASPGKLYEASVRVRGRISSGNQTFLLINWMDEWGGHLGRAIIDRVLDEKGIQNVKLYAVGEAPEHTAFIGVGVYVYNQMERDFAVFSGLSLAEVALPSESRASRP